MSNIVITFDDDFVDRLAKALGGKLETEARQTLADAGMTGPGAEPPDDPWSPPAVPTAPPAQPSAPSPPQPRTVTVNTPRGAQQWTLGAANAVACNCGNPAAYVQGATNGKAWKRWACALGADTQNWRNKCDFSLWA